MRQTRLTLFVMVFAGGLASACTAIVAGKLSDTSEYGTAGGTSSSSGSSSGDPDRCSLLYDNSADKEVDANLCSDCIKTSCTNEVAYFCPDGKPASYLSTLQNCAQAPWNGRSPPGTGSSFYQCGKYADAGEVPNDPSSEYTHEVLAGNCITDKCLEGDAPPCRLCEVSIQKPGSGSEYSLLREDACGSCVAQKCAAQLSTCCDTSPVNDYIVYCAYTALSTNKAKCLKLPDVFPDDAGTENGQRYSDEDKSCLTSLQNCFAGCQSQCEAVTTGQ